MPLTKIWERLFLGSLKDAQELAIRNSLGITAVISLCEDEVQQALNISYVHVPITESRSIPSLCFSEIMAAIAQRITKGKILVHCLGGTSRSPIIVAAWLHRCGYAGIDQALTEIAELRDIDPSPVLLRSVKEQLSR